MEMDLFLNSNLLKEINVILFMRGGIIHLFMKFIN